MVRTPDAEGISPPEDDVRRSDLTLRISRRTVVIIGLVVAALAVLLFLRPLIDAEHRKAFPAVPTPIGRGVTHVVMDEETEQVVFGGIWGHPGPWESPVITLPASDVHYYLYGDGEVEFTVRRAPGSTGAVEPFTVLAEDDGTQGGEFTITTGGDFVIDVYARSFWQLQLNLDD